MSQAPNNDAEDSESSSLHTFASDVRSALDEFRDNWQRELNSENEQLAMTAHDSGDDEALDELSALPSDPNQVQVRAERLFCKAVELEQRGKVYDALPYYRKAIQIVPDIEFKYYESQKLNTPTSVESTKKVHSPDATKESKTTEDVDEEIIDDLYEKFGHDLSAANYSGRLFLNNRDAGVLATELHLSDLPPEIIMYVLRWVVSTQLDVRSLEQCAAVCKGLYLCARDEELWRAACKRVWGHNVGTLASSNEDDFKIEPNKAPRYYSWREMFQLRERVLFSGCYISKTTYLRMGENSFQDQFYRPVQLVEYYRYIRFLPDGKAYMMTNADEPAQGVNKLKQLHNLRSDILRGRYRLFGDTVTVVLQKSQAHQNTQQTYARQRRGSFLNAPEDASSTQYVIEFRILNSPKRRFAQLVWLSYSVVQKRNKIETSSQFDMIPAKYPPLWFSPVRSYHLDADAPLI